MKEIKLSGREVAVVRAIGFALPINGTELREATHIDPESLVDILNALIGSGYVECTPYAEQTSERTLDVTEFETNASYGHELRAAIGWRRR